MDRAQEFLKFIRKDLLGIEFGPWYCPVAPKSAGYRSLTLDVFDAEKLRKLATENPNIPNEAIVNIEEVDLVGTAASLEALINERGQLGAFDYVVSSHNLEHLPNPIQFLRSCGNVLKRGGTVSLALPDRRACYDYFRPLSTIGGWIEAYLENRVRPTFAQSFEAGSLFSPFMRNGLPAAGFTLNDDPSSLAPPTGLQREYQLWMSRVQSADTEYHDTHCWTFTPTSFRLIIEAAHFLQLCPFEVIEVSENNGLEFYAHLRNIGYAAISRDEDVEEFYKRRYSLLHAAHSEAASNTLESLRLRAEIERTKSVAANLAHRCADLDARVALLAAAEAQVAALKASSSWRLTAPLRWMKSRIQTVNR